MCVYINSVRCTRDDGYIRIYIQWLTRNDSPAPHLKPINLLVHHVFYARVLFTNTRYTL